MIRRNQEVFNQLANELAGLDLSDEDLRSSQMMSVDPRHDERYEAGRPPKDTTIEKLENIYKLDSGTVPVPCMFSNHRHRSGVGFLFSDGKLRCIGPQCFSELASHAGLRLDGLASVVGTLRKRKSALDALEVSAKSLRKTVESAESLTFRQQCSDHVSFKEAISTHHPECWKFWMMAAMDSGRIRIRNGRWAPTDNDAALINVPELQALHSYPNAEYRRVSLIARANHWLDQYKSVDTKLGNRVSRQVQEDFRAIKTDLDGLATSLTSFDKFLSGDGLRSAAQAWNTYASHGNLLNVSTNSISLQRNRSKITLMSIIESRARVDVMEMPMIEVNFVS